MKLKNLCNALNSYAPEKKYKCEGDKVGLFIGDTEREIKKIVTSIDASMPCVDFAIENKADMILCHHPLMFEGPERITTDDPFGKRIYKLVSNNIAVYSMHTNLDSAPGGLNDIIADLLKLDYVWPLTKKILITDGEEKKYKSIGRIGELKNEMTLADFKLFCEDVFEIPQAKPDFYFDGNRKVKRVALCSGSGKSVYDKACEMGADVFVCGDVPHSLFVKSYDTGTPILDLGHYETECFSSVILSDYVKNIKSNNFLFPNDTEFRNIEVLNFEEYKGNRLVKIMLESRKK